MKTLLRYKPIYHQIIPHRAEQLGQVRLPSLRIQKQVSRRRQRTSSEELSDELNQNVALARALDLADRASTLVPLVLPVRLACRAMKKLKTENE